MQEQFDCSKVVLTKGQQNIFKKFNKNDSVILTISEYEIMYPTGLLLKSIGGKDPSYFITIKSGLCKLSYRGLLYRAYLHKIKTKNRAEWIRYIITTVIAVCALVLSIISLA